MSAKLGWFTAFSLAVTCAFCQARLHDRIGFVIDIIALCAVTGCLAIELMRGRK